MSIGSVSSGSAQAEFIQQILFLESRPLRNLQARRGALDVRAGIFSDVRSKLDNLKNLLSGFSDLNNATALRQFAVTSSDESSVTATADTTAEVGSHRIDVEFLAQAHTLASDGLVGTDSDLRTGTHEFEITVGGTTTQVSVTVNEGEDNATVMDKVVNAIRDSGAEVQASLITTDTNTDTRSVVLTSKETGTANIIESIRDVGGGRLMRDLGLRGNSSPGNFSDSTTVEGQDAKFTLDGIAITAGSNEVSGVIEGLVISLKSPGEPTDPPVDLGIAFDQEAIKTKLQELIDGYNDVVGYLNQKLTSGDENGEGRGDLAGDLTFRTFRNELVQSLTRSVTSALEDVDTLDDVGLSVARDGTLSLTDSEALFNALSATPDGVEAYFGGEDGIAGRLEELAKAFTKLGGGLDLKGDLLESRKDLLDLRIERMERTLSIREEQLLKEMGRLSQFVAQIGAQNAALQGLFSQQNQFFGF